MHSAQFCFEKVMRRFERSSLLLYQKRTRLRGSLVLSVCNQNNIKKSKSLGENGERFCRFSISFLGVIVFCGNRVCTVHCALGFHYRYKKEEVIIEN